MKAAVLHAIDDLKVQDYPEPTCADGWELVQVKSCGVCSTDIARIKRNGTYDFPIIPGHEYAGVTSDNRFVAVYPLVPCYKCEQCQRGAYQCCTNYNYTGSRCDGGFAEKVAAPSHNLVEMPAGITAEEAAMTEPAAVAMHAIERAGVKEGDTVAIIGCGTIGLIAAQIARAKGAQNEILMDISNERLELAQGMGFHHVENSNKDVAAKLGACADVVMEMVGLSTTYNLAIDLAKGGGRIVLTGNIGEDLVVPRKRVSTVLRKEVNVMGSWNSIALGDGLNDWRQVMDLQAEGRIDLKHLISHRISLDELPSMIDRMSKGEEHFGKVMVKF